MTNIKKQFGFSLVELSIVLVILALLAASVVGGNLLIADAKFRTIISEKNNLALAINSFKLKYDFLPGDLPNAYDIWGSSCAASAYDCNGTGDGKVWWNQKTAAAGVAAKDCPTSQEPLMEFVHLKLAGMINGTYSGACGDINGEGSITNDSAMRSGLSPVSRWMATSVSEFPGWSPDPWIGYGAWFPFLSFYSYNSLLPNAEAPGKYVFVLSAINSRRDVLVGVLTSTEALRIDIKFDDGLPQTGSILGAGSHDTYPCQLNALYSNDSSGGCSLAFFSDF